MTYAEFHIAPLATIHRKRTLPIPGLVQCNYGDTVAADRIIAEVEMPAGYHVLDLEQLLGVRVRDARRILVKEVGAAVVQGDVVARVGRLVKKECVSPATGKILNAGGRKVLIEVAPQHIRLTAFYPGKIVNLVPERGAVIEVTGALVQGTWGTGPEVRGRLECLVPDGGTPLSAAMITAAHMGTVLVGGRAIDTDVIAQAVQNQVSGVIVGSVTSELVPAIKASGLSLVVTEGFGDFAVNPDAFELLQAYSGRECCLNPFLQMRWDVRRPEVVIPLPAEGKPPTVEYVGKLDVGARVRVLRAPYEHAIGQVVSFPSQPQRLDSGIRAFGAVIDLDGTRVFAPFENLEIVH
jgi:hypothetical protein